MSLCMCAFLMSNHMIVTTAFVAQVCAALAQKSGSTEVEKSRLAGAITTTTRCTTFEATTLGSRVLGEEL